MRDQLCTQIRLSLRLAAVLVQLNPSSVHSRDMPFGRLTREETIQMSLDSATISGVRRFMIAHTRS
jgi:hypothetical protein